MDTHPNIQRDGHPDLDEGKSGVPESVVFTRHVAYIAPGKSPCLQANGSSLIVIYNTRQGKLGPNAARWPTRGHDMVSETVRIPHSSEYLDAVAFNQSTSMMKKRKDGRALHPSYPGERPKSEKSAEGRVPASPTLSLASPRMSISHPNNQASPVIPSRHPNVPPRPEHHEATPPLASQRGPPSQRAIPPRQTHASGCPCPPQALQRDASGRKLQTKGR